MLSPVAIKSIDISVILAAAATIPLVTLQAQGHSHAWLLAADWIVWCIFLCDMLAHYARRSSPASKLLSLVIVIASFPAAHHILALTRVAQLMRLLRLIRVVAVLAKVAPILRATVGRKAVLFVTTLSGFLVLASGGLLWVVEPHTVADYWTGVWWAVVTTTTVGYGDIAPQTVVGRLIAVVLMVAGIGLFATLGASVAAYFIGSDTEDRLARIEERLSRIEDKLPR